MKSPRASSSTTKFTQLLLSALVTLTGHLSAALSRTIDSIDIANPFYIIDADATNLSRDFQGFDTEFDITIQNTAAGDPFHIFTQYRVAYQLMAENGGSPIPVTLSGGSTIAFTSAQSVFLNTGIDSSQFTLEGLAIPQDPLDTKEQYFIQAQLQSASTIGTVTWTNVADPGATDSSTPTICFEFNNTTSGDLAYNIETIPFNLNWTKTHALATDTTDDGFGVNIFVYAMRYDEFNSPLSSITAEVTVDFDLIEQSSGTSITLENDGIFTKTATANSHDDSGGTNLPTFFGPNFFGFDVNEQIVPLSQLDSVNETYILRATVRHTENAFGTQEISAICEIPAQQLLHFNGNLDFDPSLAAIVNQFSNTPSPASTTATYVNTTIQVPADGGTLVTRNDVSFGTDNNLNVRLYPNGDMDLTNGTETAYPTGSPATVSPICLANPEVTFGPVTLGTFGARANGLTVSLPQGATFFKDTIVNTFLGATTIDDSQIVTLDDQLCWTSTLNLTSEFTPNSAIADESHPILFQTSELNLGINGGLEFSISSATYAHEPSYNILQNLLSLSQLDNPDMAVRCSNDRYFLNIVNTSSSLLFSTANDGTARSSVDIQIDPDDFQTHFPKKSTIQYTDVTEITLRDGLIASGDGAVMKTVAPIAVSYYRDCLEDDCHVELATVTCDTIDGNLYFTPGGGLHAFGDPNGINSGAGHVLEWGKRDASDYSHRTDKFNEGNYYMPGYQLYATDNALLNNGVYQATAGDNAASALLLSAFNRDPFGDPDLHIATEPEYDNGNGDFAGLTFEVQTSNFQGASRLADNTTDYPYDLLEDQDGSLDGNEGSKYYIREGGVSGRQIGTDGTYPNNLKLYGFECEIVRFQFSFLDSNNEEDGCESWVDGAIAVGGPPTSNYSDWIQAFFSLRFDCLGQPGEMTPDLSDADDKALTYWTSTFDLKAMEFDTFETNPGACPKNYGGNLAVGATLRASHVPQTLSGTLAFQPNGNLTTLADVIGGTASIDSQLRLPASIALSGPNKDYNLVTTTKLRFNNPLESGAPPHGDGIVTFAATIDIPYFKDLEVQALTTSTTNDDPANDSATFSLTPGWTESSQTFFNNAQFDPNHRSFPPSGITYTEYKTPTDATNETYLIKATQDMFGFIPLSYPLLWDDTTRRFASSTPRKQDIFVAQMEHKVDWMDAKFTNISFGATYDGLPELKLTNFLNNQIDAAADAISMTIGNAAKTAIDTGLDELDKMLEDALCELINPVVDTAAGTQGSPGPIRLLYRSFNTFYLNNPASDYATFRQEVKNALDNPSDLLISTIPELKALQDQLCLIADTGGDAASFITQIEEALEDIIKGIDAISIGIDGAQDYTADVSVPTIGELGDLNDLKGILFKNGSNEREIIPALIDILLVELVEPQVRAVLEPLLDSGTSALNDELNALLEDIDPALDQINDALTATRAFLVEVHTQVTTAGAIVTQFTTMISNAKSGQLLNDLLRPVTTAAWSLFLQIEQALGIDQALIALEPFADYADSIFSNFNEDQFVQLVKDELKDAILGSDIVTQTQYLLRQTLYDISDQVTSALQSVLAQMSTVMKEIINSAIGPLEEEINSLLGDVSDYMGSGEISGYAEFNGDSLRKLRLDAKMQFKVPEDMALHVYLEILSYSSEDNFVESGCVKPGEKVVEVRIGAQDVSVEWISECKINLEVKMSLKDRDGPGGLPPLPIGVGGSFELADGEIDFEAFKLLEFGATMAVGLEECYLGAKARAIFSNYEVAAALFFGRTCTLEPLLFVDPDIGDVLTGGDSFTGAYVYGEVWLPISELVLGIPASCLFRIDAGVGAGAFFFVQGDLNDIDASDIVIGGKIFLGVSGEALCVVSIKGEIKIILASQGGVLRGAGTGKFSAKVGWCPFCIKFSKSVKLLYDDGDWSMQ